MIRKKDDDDWLCDICKTDLTNTTPKNRCLICDYDECDSCFKRNSGLPLSVRHGHKLREGFVTNICKLCKDRVEPGAVAFQCNMCLAVQCIRCRVSRPDPQDNRDFKHVLHEHMLDYCLPYGDTPYRCDICELELTGNSFHCSDCKYDICRLCMGSVNEVLPRHSHFWKFELPSWQCSRCTLTYKTSSACFQCADCDYRECHQCYPTVTGQKLPPHPHPLSFSSAYPAGWICDLCQTTFPRSIPSYHCDQCGYDECNFCIVSSH